MLRPALPGRFLSIRSFRLRPSIAAAVLLSCAQAAFAADALSYAKNYFVTGDYAVAGVALRGKGAAGFARGTIDMSGVPAGADIVAAFLYWETVERTPAPSAANGFFDGKAIVGDVRGNAANPACWGTSGTSGPADAKGRVYRADVLPYLAFDATTKVRLVNGPHTIQLPDIGGDAPSAAGASLVVVYRILTPGTPLRAVVIYDGAYSMDRRTPAMTLTVGGFYQSVPDESAKMTHIAANGQSNFGSILSVDGTTVGIDKFKGAQGAGWDNATFDINLPANAASFATQVTTSDSQLCLTWAAIVTSTVVKDTDFDGLLDIWETEGLHLNPGDATHPATFGGCTFSEPCVDLSAMGADPFRPDVFIETDWLRGGDGHLHRPKLEALSVIADAFSKRSIAVHFDVGDNYQSPRPSFIVPAAYAKGGEGIDESMLPSNGAPYGFLDWKTGFRQVKEGIPALGMPSHFDNQRKDAFHYMLFAHALASRASADSKNVSGVADRFGGDLMITLGLQRSDNPEDDQIGSTRAQAGAILQELGHNLGLSLARKNSRAWTLNLRQIAARSDVDIEDPGQLDETTLEEPVNASAISSIETASTYAARAAASDVAASTTAYRAITIDHTKVGTVNGTDQINFPVLVSGTYPFLATVANGGKVQNVNGYDVGFFINADCLTGKLNWETEKYVATTGEVAYWVRVNTLSHSSDTVIYLCYGDGSISTDQSNKTAVWDSSYRAVYHLAENPQGAAPQIKDSTANGYNLTTATTAGTPATIVGKIDRAVALPTTNQYFGTTLDSSTAIGAGGTPTYTISGWVNINSHLAHDGNRSFLFGLGAISPYTNAVVGLDDTNKLFFEINKSATWGNKTTPLSPVISMQTWYHVVGTNNGNNVTLYLNGNPIGSTGSTGNDIDNQYFHIGKVYPYGFTDAEFDEIRASDSARSADWIITEYNNQSSPSTFYTLDTERSVSVVAPNPPQSLTGSPANGQVSLSWLAPSFDGGANIIDYNVQSKTSASSTYATIATVGAPALNYTATGLTNGTSYDFRVSARNSSGTSSPSNTFTATPVTIPNAPVIGVATAGYAMAQVSFTAPASNGGTPITSYTATSNPGGFTQTGTSSPITVIGLTIGTDYTFIVTATNAVGTSAPSASSNVVRPVDITVISSVQSGNWSAASTWAGGVVPGNGYGVIIASGHAVTVDVDTTIGKSGVNGTVAITTQAGSRLIIGAGRKLQVRGDTILGGTAGIQMNAGSTWEFDSSAAPTPQAIQYRVRPAADGSILFLDARNCTATSRCRVASNAGGGNGYFTTNGFAYAGGVKAYYTDFVRLGDASRAAIQIWFRSTDGSIPWDVQNSTFDASGSIDAQGTDPGPGGTVIHRHVIHTNTVGLGIYLGNFASTLTTGTREISYSVFDKIFGSNDNCSSQAGDLNNVSIHDNYFHERICGGWSGLTSQLQYNFFRKPAGNWITSGDTLDNYYFNESPLHDHAPDIGRSVTSISFLRNIWDSSFPAFDNLNIHDGIVGDASNGQTAITIKYNIVLPGADGIGSNAIEDIRAENTATHDIQHNTIIPNGVGGVMYEYETTATGDLGTIANNIFWDTTPRFVAFNGAFHYPLIATNPFLPSKIQNNDRFNIAATVPGCTSCTNQGNGYASAWTATPGGTDLTVDPRFIDTKRNLATFDSAYLSHVASAAWAALPGTQTFQVGDIVSDQSPGYFGNAIINYRAIAPHAKSTANSQPGVGSAWHNYWEFASLQSIRNAVANGSTITDPAIGASNATYVVALEKWVQTGFSPTNAALKGAASDGGDIGAMPFVDKTGPAVTVTTPALAAVVAGSSVAVTAVATDDVAVAGVKFYLDGSTLINSEVTSTSGPNTYTTTWNSAATTDGVHNLRAVARDAAGNVTTSSSVSITVDNTAPVISAIAASPSGTTATITWTTNEPADSKVEYGLTTNYTNSSSLDPTLITSHSVSLSGLTASATYHYHVISRDKAGNVTTSPDNTLVAQNSVPTITSFAASPSTITKGLSSTLSWSVSGASSISIDNGVTFAQGATSATISPTATTTYTLTATNSSGSATQSVTVTVVPDTAAPTAPTALAATAVSSTQINLVWQAATDNVGVVGYKIFRAQGTGTSTQIGTATALSYSDQNLTAATSYTYKVAAYDAAGNTSAFSATSSATTLAAADTTPPVISSLQKTGITQTSATITWTTNEPATSFVDYGLTTSYGQTAGNNTLVTSHSVQLTGLTAGTLYNFKVRSADAAANLASSANQTFTTSPLDTPPAAVTDLAVTNVGPRQVTVTWTAPGNDGMVGTASSYDIRYSTQPITESSWANATQVTSEPAPAIAGTSQSDNINQLSRNTTYYFALKTKDTTGNISPLSNVVSATTK